MIRAQRPRFDRTFFFSRFQSHSNQALAQNQWHACMGPFGWNLMESLSENVCLRFTCVVLGAAAHVPQGLPYETMWVLFSAAPPKSPDLALTAPIASHPSLHRQVRRRSGRDAFIGVVGVVVVGRCRRARAQARPRPHVRLASKRRRALQAERPRGVQRCGLRLSTALRSRRRRAASRNRARMQPARHRPRACPPWRARRDAR